MTSERKSTRILKACNRNCNCSTPPPVPNQHTSLIVILIANLNNEQYRKQHSNAKANIKIYTQHTNTQTHTDNTIENKSWKEKWKTILLYHKQQKIVTTDEGTYNSKGNFNKIMTTTTTATAITTISATKIWKLTSTRLLNNNYIQSKNERDWNSYSIV